MIYSFIAKVNFIENMFSMLRNPNKFVASKTIANVDIDPLNIIPNDIITLSDYRCYTISREFFVQHGVTTIILHCKSYYDGDTEKIKKDLSSSGWIIDVS